jgi:hypothetical protein
MEAYDAGDGLTRIRWLLLGRFSPAPSGRVTRVRKGELAEAMTHARLRAAVNVRDRLGGEDRRAVELGICSLAELRLDGVVDAVPSLASLRDLAKDLASADPQKRPSPEEAVTRVVEIVGEGTLANALREVLLPKPPTGEPRSVTPPPKPSHDSHAEAASPEPATAVDKIFSKVDVEQAAGKPASSAVDSFVRLMRSGKDGATYRTPSSQARKARAAIEDAVYATAADVLRHPVVNVLDSAWRGAKLVLDQAPSREEVELILLDVAPDAVPGAIEEALPEEIDKWPDAVFLLDACDNPTTLASLCELAEGLNIPMVAAVSPETLEAIAGSGTTALPEGWDALRQTEASRWLSLCANRVVLAAEGIGTAERVVFGSPTLIGAAVLTASYRDTGSFGRVFGKQGALRMPATWQPRAGTAADAMLPLEALITIDAQNSLSELGVAAFGSARNSDQIRLTRWPTVRDNKDAVPLPAQVITGRVVRFAQWVRDQLPPGVNNEDVERIFEDAASVFLFGGLSKGFEFGAAIEQKVGHPSQLKVAVRIHPALASVPLTLVFPLSLRT